MTKLFKRKSPYEKELEKALSIMIGKKPLNLDLFKLATLHSSASKEEIRGLRTSNERLEYLGDAVLDLVIAEFLFKKYPFKEEGFLTEVRSRFVNREVLNDLAEKIGLNDIIRFESQYSETQTPKSVLGNALEAIVGAVYLDRGYEFSKKFILDKLIQPHFDVEEIIRNNPNYKSQIIEWAQKENKDLKFETVEIKDFKKRKEFTVQVVIDDEPFGEGSAQNKKKAEQAAAQKSCEMLNLIDQ